MNLYALLAGVILWGGSLGAAGWWSYGAGRDHVIAQQSIEDKAATRAADAAASAVAVAIGKITLKQVTIRQNLEREVRENTIYRDCRSGPAAVQLLNSTPGVAPANIPIGASELPASGAAH